MALVDVLVLAVNGRSVHMVPVRAASSERALALVHRDHTNLTTLGAIGRSQLDDVLATNDHVVVVLEGRNLLLLGVRAASEERALIASQQAQPHVVPVGVLNRARLSDVFNVLA